MTNKLFTQRKEDAYSPRILSDDEIEMYLKGDRREVDKLILCSLNRLAACLIPLAEQEEDRGEALDRLFKNLGGVDLILKRAKFVDAAITSVEVRTNMMTKVATSSLTWALPLFITFILVSVWDSIVNTIKVKLGG